MPARAGMASTLPRDIHRFPPRPSPNTWLSLSPQARPGLFTLCAWPAGKGTQERPHARFAGMGTSAANILMDYFEISSSKDSPHWL